MESNAYFVVSDKVCVIDSGVDSSRVLNRASDYHIGIDVLINTHCHFDHVGGNLGVLKSGTVRAFAHELDAPALEGGDGSFQLSGLFGYEPVKHPVDVKLRDKDVVDLGKIRLEVVHTPGHTRGSICLFEPESKTLFSGDTVFANGIGRTDLKGGSLDDLEESIRKLSKFVQDRGVEKIMPGHGPEGRRENVENALELYF